VEGYQGIQQTNFAFDKLFRTKQGETIGLPLSALVNSADVEKLETVIQALVQTHKVQQVELLAQLHNKNKFD